MTLFEELCKDMGIGKNTEAEKCMSEIVDDLLFDETYRPDDELIAEAKRCFVAKYE